MSNLMKRLVTLHRRLDADVRRELARMAPDPARVATLKKRKLMIKDRLQRAGRGPAPV
jgi:hypothetical protein